MRALDEGRRLLWYVRRGVVSLGWQGVMGLLLLAFAAGLYVNGIVPARVEAAQLSSERDSLAERVRVRGPQSSHPTVQGQLSEFYRFFPPIESVPDTLGRIQAAAQRHGLILDKGEYRMEGEQGFAVRRYQVTLPVAGTYAQVRSFVNNVLDEIPYSAVDELILNRKNIAHQNLEVRVRFSVFLIVPKRTTRESTPGSSDARAG